MYESKSFLYNNGKDIQNTIYTNLIICMYESTPPVLPQYLHFSYIGAID